MTSGNRCSSLYDLCMGRRGCVGGSLAGAGYGLGGLAVGQGLRRFSDVSHGASSSDPARGTAKKPAYSPHQSRTFNGGAPLRATSLCRALGGPDAECLGAVLFRVHGRRAGARMLRAAASPQRRSRRDAGGAWRGNCTSGATGSSLRSASRDRTSPPSSLRCRRTLSCSGRCGR